MPTEVWPSSGRFATPESAPRPSGSATSGRSFRKRPRGWPKGRRSTGRSRWRSPRCLQATGDDCGPRNRGSGSTKGSSVGLERRTCSRTRLRPCGWSWHDPRPLLAAQQNGGLTVGHTSLTLHSQPEGLPARDNSVRPAIAASRKIRHSPVGPLIQETRDMEEVHRWRMRVKKQSAGHVRHSGAGTLDVRLGRCSADRDGLRGK
jgi:hypothetical protein